MAHAGKDLGYNRIYVCGSKAYDNELAMYRHEGVNCHESCKVETVFEPHPRFAYRIINGNRTLWVTDPVDVIHTRRHAPDAEINVVEVIR